MGTNLVIEISKKTSKYISRQIEISDTDLNSIRQIFSLGDDDPLMYNSYKIDENINELLHNALGLKLNIELYDCYAGYRES